MLLDSRACTGSRFIAASWLLRRVVRFSQTASDNDLLSFQEVAAQKQPVIVLMVGFVGFSFFPFSFLSCLCP